MNDLDNDFELWWNEEGNIFANEEFKEQKIGRAHV